MSKASTKQNRSLSQTLAVQSQIHMAGTVGRLLKQIRDLEEVAPLFVKAGLVRSVDRPNPLSVRVAGIATRSATTKTIGGFLYAATGVRMDLQVQDNVLSTVSQDSVCEIDDINYEDQSKRLALIGLRQGYQLADAAMRAAIPYDLILLDSPLLLNRSMVPLREGATSAGHRAAYTACVETISRFWAEHREKLYPWDKNGPAILGLDSGRYGALVQVAQQDLRTREGRKHILETEEVDAQSAVALMGSEEAFIGIGERRFIHGILSGYTRTVAFRMDAQTPRMEPGDVADLGVLGLHFKAGQHTEPHLLQLIGSQHWTPKSLDRILGQVMALMLVGGSRALPLPVYLAGIEQNGLPSFLDSYRLGIREELKRREVEEVWLSDTNLDMLT